VAITGIKPIWVGLGRAAGGAIVFTMPIMMTMEMWQLGFYISPLRLVALIVLSLPLFISLASLVGFRKSKDFADNVADVFVAYAVTFVATGLVLVTLGIITFETKPGVIYTMLLLQAVPGTLGALLARNIVGESSEQSENEDRNYRDDLTILAAGAVFLAFSLAPTEEMILLSYMMSTKHTLFLLLLTLPLMHAFSIAGANVTGDDLKKWSTHRELFLRFTSIGYLIAFIISIFMLWVFESTGDQSIHNTIKTTIVLAFPAGIGAAASRLIL
jgi:putative integral membrane protein (TIGR02587 family)